MYMDKCYLLIFFISLLVMFLRMKQAHKTLIQEKFIYSLALKSFQKSHLHVYMYL